MKVLLRHMLRDVRKILLCSPTPAPPPHAPQDPQTSLSSRTNNGVMMTVLEQVFLLLGLYSRWTVHVLACHLLFINI